jgi:hypothetical protein
VKRKPMKKKKDDLRKEYDFAKLIKAPGDRRPRLAPEAVTALRACLDFRPDAAHINALPEPLGRNIHDLETRADPAGRHPHNPRTA